METLGISFSCLLPSPPSIMETAIKKVLQIHKYLNTVGHYLIGHGTAQIV